MRPRPPEPQGWLPTAESTKSLPAFNKACRNCGWVVYAYSYADSLKLWIKLAQNCTCEASAQQRAELLQWEEERLQAEEDLQRRLEEERALRQRIGVAALQSPKPVPPRPKPAPPAPPSPQTDEEVQQLAIDRERKAVRSRFKHILGE